MDLASLKRHMPSIEEGRWITADEIPALIDVRVKVRGMTSASSRELAAKRQRAVEPSDRDAQGNIKAEAWQRLIVGILSDHVLIDVEGLTMNGKPVTVDELRKLLPLPEYQPIADILLQAAGVVDATREAQVEAIAGN